MYTEGQKLWFVPTQLYLGEPREVTITKVGRKWLTLDNGYRASVASLRCDGGNFLSPASCYLSREEWEGEVALMEWWSNFQRSVGRSNRVPDGVTVQSIRGALQLLGMQIKEE